LKFDILYVLVDGLSLYISWIVDEALRVKLISRNNMVDYTKVGILYNT